MKGQRGTQRAARDKKRPAVESAPDAELYAFRTSILKSSTFRFEESKERTNPRQVTLFG